MINFFVTSKSNFILKKIKHNPSFKNISWLMTEKLLKLFLNLLVNIWIARYLGPENFGLLNYSIALVAIFTSLASLGIDGIVVRELVRNKTNTHILLGTAFFIKLFGGLSSVLLIYITCLFSSIKGESLTVTMIISLSFILNSFLVIDLWYQKLVKSKYSVISRVVGMIIFAVVNITFILLEKSTEWFAISILLETIITILGLVYFYILQNNKISKWNFSWVISKQILTESWPLIISGMAVVVYMRIDQIMIGNISGNKELAIYSVAVRIAELWYAIPVIIMSTMYPMLIKLKEFDKSKYSIRLQQIYDFMSLLGIVIAIPVTFFSNEIIRILYGMDYLNAGPILSLYIWIGIFVSIGTTNTSYLNMNMLTKFSMLASVAGVITNISLNILLIPLYGALGATIASIISYWIQSHGVYLFIPSCKELVKIINKALLIPFRLVIFIKRLNIKK
ncbi:flippase [Niallia circulans]|uniref:flippase n=1 Tax=Niallia circulans TaxID=1397 RepID=UPI002E1BB1D2|nr:flippase [Niallia circulans]